MEVNITGQGNENQLLTMLAWIEWCGNVGHTPKYLKVYIDGDGATRLRFNFKDKEHQEKYEQIRKDITNEWNHHGKDIEYVEL